LYKIHTDYLKTLIRFNDYLNTVVGNPLISSTNC